MINAVYNDICEVYMTPEYNRCYCGSYGTGAVMAVPGHDSRDYEFALKYDIPIRWVVMPDDKSTNESGKAFPGEGIIVNSSNTLMGLDINGLCSKEAALKVIDWAEKSGNGKKKVHTSNYSKLVHFIGKLFFMVCII